MWSVLQKYIICFIAKPGFYLRLRVKVFPFSGVFFLPRDQQHDRPSKTTNYEGLAYLGGYALAWAACLGNETIYNILLEKVWAYNDTFYCAMNSF